MSDSPDDDATSSGEPAPPQRSRAAGWRGALRETALVVGTALVVSLVVKTFLLQVFSIPSISMEQTLDVGDRVAVGKLAPGPFDLHRGDVVVFVDPGGWLREAPAGRPGAVETTLTSVGLLPDRSENHLVKRIVGLPGDHVVCCDGSGRVTVNGTAVDESGYLAAGVVPSVTPFDVTVPAGDLWVLGDNRSRSQDSRYHPQQRYGGFVPIDLVVGRAHAVVWPVGHWTWLGTPDAFDAVGGASGAS